MKFLIIVLFSIFSVQAYSATKTIHRCIVSQVDQSISPGNNTERGLIYQEVNGVFKISPYSTDASGSMTVFDKFSKDVATQSEETGAGRTWVEGKLSDDGEFTMDPSEGVASSVVWSGLLLQCIFH